MTLSRSTILTIFQVAPLIFNAMTRHESLFAEIIYDLSYLAGQDDLIRFIEDSRELFEMVKDWAETFDCRYPMPRNVVCDFSELHGDDYITAIDKFYIEVRNEYMADYHNITSAVILNELFKIKC